ncbi:SIS domain-containing protein [Sediminispirochaeta bajacaliforniensis]|uniref:SIS domain-containing protein n=1 Tax=Sediminispirochaeta bajacaliforniensis TaxID=148 RepID=UPI00037A5B21|nr:SIS domain-containing protein [Sediminispirochaeta bajacaliforniensis]
MLEEQIIADILKAKKDVGGIDKVFFTACGGSIAAFYPCKFLLESESRKLRRIGYYSANEFVHATPASLDKNSLVIACSHQGTTPETIEAIKLARSKGASTIAFSYAEGSEITKYGDRTIIYEWGPASSEAQQKASKGLRIAIEVLNQLEGWKYYDAAMKGFEALDSVVTRAKEMVRPAARKFAQENALEKLIYTIGSGASFGSAYIEDICILKEMQWIHSSSIHSGEFFHGPLEIADTQTPFLLFLSEGRTRPLDERVLSFLKRYAAKIYTIDVRDLGINVIDDTVSEYFSPLVLTNIVALYNEELAYIRKHPLMTRRYMWKVKY